MKRIFISDIILKAGVSFVLPESEVHHLKVLRIKSNEVVELMNGQGQIAEGFLRFENQKNVIFLAQDVKDFERPSITIALFQSVLLGAPFEEVLEHGTELGVMEFHPLLTERTQVPGEKISTLAKQLRYQMILKEACKQSGNPFLPQLFLPEKFKNKINELQKNNTLRFIGSLQDDAKSMMDYLIAQKEVPESIEIFIGPEGGWTENEELEARQNGILPMKLGSHTLRAKTASLASLSVVSSFISMI